MSADYTPLDPDQAFIHLAQIVLGEQPLSEILENVVHVASNVLPAKTEASITLVSGESPATAAFTGELALALDERQYETERGPCLDAAVSGQIILISELSSDKRWPQFAQAANECGIGSSLSVPLPMQRDLTGALNFYANKPNGFDKQSIDLAQTFADHAAIAVANAHLYETTATLSEHMRQAMATRAVIDQAKGIIMGERRCTPEEALDVLVRLSQDSHLKLRDVAQRLVEQVTDTDAPTPGLDG